MNKKKKYEEEENKSSKASDPCDSECKKINQKINNRKLSELKNNEVAHILKIFEDRK